MALPIYFCYINTQRGYLINCIEKLFANQPTQMFYQNTIYVIHTADSVCQPPNRLSNDTTDSLNDTVNQFVSTYYPKNRFIALVFNVLLNHNLITKDLFFDQFPTIHIVDFASFIQNKFGDKHKIDPFMLKLLKSLQSQHIKFPRIAIKNPVAKKYLL